MSKVKRVYGVGINDSGYVVQPINDGARSCCPFYKKWKAMLERCYSASFHKRQPSYIGCTVDSRWHTFSIFKRWMESKDWEGMQLDKDLLIKGNKVYGPDTCVFVDSATNKLFTNVAIRLDSITYDSKKLKYTAQCNDGKGNPKYLGHYVNKYLAIAAYRVYKNEVILAAANKQQEPKVKAAILARLY